MTEPKAAAQPTSAATRGNPLLSKWTAPFDLPPFEKIQPQHFRPAIDKAISDHKAEVEKILSSAASPTFAPVTKDVKAYRPFCRNENQHGVE